jgi:Uncharacterized protein conserved in bacteria
MKHFIVEIIYLAAYEQIATVTPKHREFLQKGYDQGWLLMSGPQNPKKGGVVVCKAPSLEAIQEFFKNDPYFLAKMTDYRFIEFEPVKHAALLDPWLQ